MLRIEAASSRAGIIVVTGRSVNHYHGGVSILSKLFLRETDSRLFSNGRYSESLCNLPVWDSYYSFLYQSTPTVIVQVGARWLGVSNVYRSYSSIATSIFSTSAILILL